MPLHPDDPRLTAYLLGELPAIEAAAVEHALAADPALRAALEELTDTQRALTDMLAPGGLTLLPGQRAAIRRAARQRPWQPWLVPLAAAAAITLAAVVFIPQSARWRQAGTNHPAAATSPAAPQPAPKVVSKAAPVAAPAALAETAGAPVLELPVQAGRASLGNIRDAIRTGHRLPPRDAVRLEEILNCFALVPHGLTAIARNPANHWHPDDRGTGATSHAATLATETLACPWQPSASLVLVTFRANPSGDCEIKAAFHANPTHILRCRLLGFAPVAGHPPNPLSNKIVAGSSTSLVIEVEPATAAGDLGAIEWSVDGEPAATMAITRHGDAEPSDDARFAALACAFAQWLAGDPSGVIDADLLAALARQSDSSSLPADRADFLQLIDQALKL